MPSSIHVFENSLKEYLVNMQSDSYNTCNQIRYKYNNLKVYMEPEKNSVPHFWVSVNISSVCFGIEPLTKICGSLGADERYVFSWASRANINGELRKHWAYLVKSNSVSTSLSSHNDEETEEKLKIVDTNIHEASNIITGTGINKQAKEV